MKSELLFVVDEKDNIVFLFNSKKELLLQMRSSKKDKFPNTYDCSVSEHVRSGETYKEAAYRGLREELGIKRKINLIKLIKFRMAYGLNDNTIAVLYKCRYNGKLQINKKEVQKAEFIKLDKIKEMALTDFKFSPWTRELLKWYFGSPSRIEKIK